MDHQTQLLMWNYLSQTPLERSQEAHERYVRAEQVRQARGNRPSVVTVLARAWQGFAGSRPSVEPTELAASS